MSEESVEMSAASDIFYDNEMNDDYECVLYICHIYIQVRLGTADFIEHFYIHRWGPWCIHISNKKGWWV